MFKLRQLFDLEKLQGLIDNFSLIIGVACAIVDEKDELVITSGWENLCTKYHRNYPESAMYCRKSNAILNEKLRDGKPASEKCLLGLIDAALPIIINDEYLGAFYIGQYFREKPDIKYFIQQAQKFGYNFEEYISEVQSTNIINKDKELNILRFGSDFIKILVDLGSKNLIEIEAKSDIIKTKEKFQSLYEQTPVMMQYFDVNGKVLYVSKYWIEKTGYKLEEVMGNYFYKYFTPNSKKLAVSELLPKLINQIPLNNIHIQMKLKTNNVMDIMFTAITELDENENPSGFLAVFEDITHKLINDNRIIESQIELTNINEELRANIEELEATNCELEEIQNKLYDLNNQLLYNERKYRDLVEKIDEGITMVDYNEVIVFANPKAEDIFGVAQGGLIGKSLEEFTDIDSFIELRQKTLSRQKGVTDAYELKIKRSDGEYRIILCNVSPRYDADGKFEGTFSSMNDITERKKYESEINNQKIELSVMNDELISVMEELQASNIELSASQEQLQNSLDLIKESETVFKHMFYNSPVMMHSVSNLGFLTDVNDTWLEFFGYSRDEVIGQPVSIILSPETIELSEKEIFAKIWVDGFIKDQNMKFIKKDNTVVDVSVDSVITKELEGKRICLSAIRDITEIKKYESEIRRLASFPELNPLFVYEIDEKGNFIYSNQTGLEILSELNIKDPGIFLPSEIDKLLIELNEKQNSIYHEEIEINNRFFFKTIYLTPKFNSVRMFIEEVTARKKAEMALIESETKFADIFRLSPDILTISSLDKGCYLDVNDTFCSIMGKKREEIIGKTSKELDLWADYNDRDRILNILFTNGIVRNEEASFKVKGNEVFPALISMSKIVHMNQNCVLAVVMDISKLKRVEDQLQQNQTQLRQILDNIPFYVWLKDTNGKYLDVNKIMADAFHLQISEMIGKTDYDLEPRVLAEKYERIDNEVIKSRKRIAIEEPMSNAQPGWFEVFKAPIVNSNNEVVGVTGVARDISDRKKFEIKQKLNEARLESLNTLSLMMDAPENNIIRFTIEEAVRLTGSKIGYLFFIKDNRLQHDKIYWTSNTETKCKVVYPMDYSLDDAGIWADCVRERHPVIHNDYPNYTDRKGQPVGHIPILKHLSAPIFHNNKIIAVAGVGNKTSDYDETDALQISLLLNGMWEMLLHKQTVSSLMLSQSRLRALLDSLPHMVWLKDKEGHFIDVNEAFAHMKETNIQDMIGKTDFDYWPADLAESYLDDDREVIKSGQRKFIEEKTPEGLPVQWFETFKTPIYDPQGNVEGTVGISLDITERKLAEINQEKFNNELLHTQKLESLGIMAGSIAHNFNNLLVGILGNAELTLDELPVDSILRDGIEKIKQAAIRAAEFTNQMLVYSGKGLFEIKTINLNNLIKEMISLIEVSISKKIKLDFNLDPNIHLIKGDNVQLNQVIMNLLTNAAESMGSSEGRINISTGTIDITQEFINQNAIANKINPGTYAFLEVSDSGCGISPEQLKKIFEPFFTTKFTGRGLGLAAVQGIVKSHNGALTVQSELGVGTKFKIFIPVSKASQSESQVQSIVTPTDIYENKTIMVVDDEEHVLTVLDRILSRRKANVIKAKDGVDAIEKFSENNNYVDLVILDVTMPRMNGHEAFIELRKLNPAVKVILTSEFTEKEATEWFKDKGLNGFIQKPFQMESILSIIAEVFTSAKTTKT